jgi:hypothetical protein
MMLPPTFLEAEALQFARQWIARMQERGEILGIDGALLNPLTDHLIAKRWCRLCAEMHPQGAEQVVDLAVRFGERSAHDALVELIDEKTDRNEPLGAVLGAYSIRLRRKPFAAHSGPPRTTMLQDIIFCLLIIELVERFGLRPTRYANRKHERMSACAVAAQAAAEAGLNRGGEDAFRKVWKRTAPRILPGWRTTSPEALAILSRHIS